MAARKGFTLIEIIVVLVIVGIAAAITIPNLTSSYIQSNAQVAQNNLYAISAAQSKLNEDYPGSYCISTGASPITIAGYPALCGDSSADLNTSLHLSLGGPYAYVCFTFAGAIPYNCTATANDGTDVLTLNPNAVPPATPVTCAGPVGDCP